MNINLLNSKRINAGFLIIALTSKWYTLREVSKFGVFLVRIESESWKIRTRKIRQCILPIIFHNFSEQLLCRKAILKQTPEAFCKKGCFQKFCNIHRKTPVLESIFNKVAALLKRDSNTVTFL